MKTYLTRILAIATTWSLLVMSGYATVIASVPYVINTPGTYTFDGSLSLSGTGTAITVNASNVLIDLKGFTLSATDTPPQSVGIITANGTTHITVQNGSINGFNFGIGLHCLHYVVQNLQFFNDVAAIDVGGVNGSGEGVVQNCLIDGAGSQIRGIELLCNENVVKNNQILNYFGPNGVGVFSDGGNLFIGNSIFNCGTGLHLSSSDKYQSTLTVFCGTPFSGGIAVGNDNN